MPTIERLFPKWNEICWINIVDAQIGNNVGQVWLTKHLWRAKKATRNTFVVRTSPTLKLRSSAECSHGALVGLQHSLFLQNKIHPQLHCFPRLNALVFFFFFWCWTVWLYGITCTWLGLTRYWGAHLGLPEPIDQPEQLTQAVSCSSPFLLSRSSPVKAFTKLATFTAWSQNIPFLLLFHTPCLGVLVNSRSIPKLGFLSILNT